MSHSSKATRKAEFWFVACVEGVGVSVGVGMSMGVVWLWLWLRVCECGLVWIAMGESRPGCAELGHPGANPAALARLGPSGAASAP